MPPPAADAPPRADVDARTVFVRGLAYDASKDDLEAAFAAVGPVRSAFVVGAGAGGKHKGVGFVQFALPDDAGRAVTELDGSALKGRKIKVRDGGRRGGWRGGLLVLTRTNKTRSPPPTSHPGRARPQARLL